MKAALSTETRIKRLRTPWSRRIVELLTDGDWHDIGDVITVAAREVPPGVAFRTGERYRNRADRRPNGPGARVRGDDKTSIDTGARLVAQKTVWSLSSRTDTPLVERSAAGYMVRLAP